MTDETLGLSPNKEAYDPGRIKSIRTGKGSALALIH